MSVNDKEGMLHVTMTSRHMCNAACDWLQLGPRETADQSRVAIEGITSPEFSRSHMTNSERPLVCKPYLTVGSLFSWSVCVQG